MGGCFRDVGLRGVHRCPRDASCRPSKDSKSRDQQKTLCINQATVAQRWGDAGMKFKRPTRTMTTREALSQTVRSKSQAIQSNFETNAP